MTSICCDAECSIVSRRIITSGPGLHEVEEVEWRCMSCSHRFHVLTDKLENKLAPDRGKGE